MTMNFERYKKTGNFKLASGIVSPYYYDIKEAMGEPDNLKGFVRNLVKKHNMKDFDVIIGIDYGGIPLAVGLSLQTNLPYAVIKKQTKDHGTQKRIEGHQAIGNVLLLDDVITSGHSIREAKQYLKSLGYKIIATETVMKR